MSNEIIFSNLYVFTWICLLCIVTRESGNAVNYYSSINNRYLPFINVNSSRFMISESTLMILHTFMFILRLNSMLNDYPSDSDT